MKYQPCGSFFLLLPKSHIEKIGNNIYIKNTQQRVIFQKFQNCLIKTAKTQIFQFCSPQIDEIGVYFMMISNATN